VLAEIYFFLFASAKGSSSSKCTLEISGAIQLTLSRKMEAAVDVDPFLMLPDELLVSSYSYLTDGADLAR